jgi:hypothetical protein
MNKQRLLDVARACRETKSPEGFTMDRFANQCGTPACALGNYAVRTDLQKDFSLDPTWFPDLRFQGKPTWHNGPLVREYFDIDHDDAEKLFGPYGCGGSDPIKAAEFIEYFVRSHEQEAP